MTRGMTSAAAVLAVLLAGPAFAQSQGKTSPPPAAAPQAAAGNSQLEEVVVTARRVQDSLQSVPIAVTAKRQADAASGPAASAGPAKNPPATRKAQPPIWLTNVRNRAALRRCDI